jgi:hypothetical protein
VNSCIKVSVRSIQPASPMKATNDIEALLRKIEYWHHGSIVAKTPRSHTPEKAVYPIS